VRIKSQNEGILIEDISDFDVEQIFDCGQAFRFKKVEEGIYEGVAHGAYLKVSHVENGVFLWPCDIDAFENTWCNYFDLKTDYGNIKRTLIEIDPFFKRATEFGSGIRILRQDPWEMILSFIISANNNIPRIQGSIEKLSKMYGEPALSPNGILKYSIPSAESLSNADLSDIRACGVGYRDKYIKKTAEMIVSGAVDINKVLQLTPYQAEETLLTLSGVGKKVADCIMLFGFSYMSAFPVDTWVKKAISKHFLDESVSLKEIQSFAHGRFGNLSGYAQQYMFYYIREGKS